MKNILMALCVMFATVEAKADPRYVIVERSGQQIKWAQPSYETLEGKRNVESFRRVPADKWNGCDFWNENSKGLAVRCGFRSDRSATVIVDQNEEPVYIVGCRGGTFFNRIKLIRKEVRVPEVQPVVRRQVAYEEEERTFKTGATFGEYPERHSMEFGITSYPQEPRYMPRPRYYQQPRICIPQQPQYECRTVCVGRDHCGRPIMRQVRIRVR